MGINMKVMITGFDPFGGEKINPAYEAVKLLPAKIAGAEIVKVEIPTMFQKGPAAVEAAFLQHKPDMVLCIGQAGGRAVINIEKVAINLMEASIPDNDGKQPNNQPIEAEGPTAYFSTLPVKAMMKHVRENGIPAIISYTAGTYVCNNVMYSLLHLLATKHPEVKGGFIHVPYDIKQTITMAATMPAMPIATIAEGLRFAIEAAVMGDADDGIVAGTTH